MNQNGGRHVKFTDMFRFEAVNMRVSVCLCVCIKSKEVYLITKLTHRHEHKHKSTYVPWKYNQKPAQNHMHERDQNNAYLSLNISRNDCES